MAEAVLDASAVLAVLNQEPGAEAVVPFLADAALSAVNYAEVVSKLLERGIPVEPAKHLLDQLGLRVINFDRAQADRTGELRTATRHLGLSLADRVCLALAEREGAVVLTADRNWAALSLGIDIRTIR